MLYSPSSGLDEKVVELLAVREYTTKQLHDVLQQNDRSVSLQAVYDAVRKLMRANVVLKQHMVCSLSAEWRVLVSNKLGIVQGLPSMAEGDSVRYTFTSYEKLDAHWKHIQVLLGGVVGQQPIFYYDPHEMWIYLHTRTSSQDSFLRSFSPKGRTAFMLIGGTSEHDRHYKKMYGKYLQIDLDAGSPLKRNEHLTVVNDYVVVTRLPVHVAACVDVLYERSPNERVLKEKLNELFKKPHRLTITLYRAKVRAQNIRKRICKNMYVSSKQKKRYGLV